MTTAHDEITLSLNGPDAMVAVLTLLTDELQRRGLVTDSRPLIQGTDFSNDVFYLSSENGHEVHYEDLAARCGLDVDDLTAEPPYFFHAASGTRVWWHKHMNRSFRAELNPSWPPAAVLADCLASLPATLSSTPTETDAHEHA